MLSDSHDATEKDKIMDAVTSHEKNHPTMIKEVLAFGWQEQMEANQVAHPSSVLCSDDLVPSHSHLPRYNVRPNIRFYPDSIQRKTGSDLTLITL